MNTTSNARTSQMLASEPTNSTWVGANAGSGKTKVLIDRVTRLLLNRVAPQHILCLTYTKAAASHMQNKLFERLGTWSMLPDKNLSNELRSLGENESQIDAEKLAQARRLFARALDTPGGLKIQTIHSFCSSILRRFPLEAGISPHFIELDERNLKSLQIEILDDLANNDNTGLFAKFSSIFHLENSSNLLSEISKYREFFTNINTKEKIFSLFNINPNLKLTDILEIGFLNYDFSFLTDALELLEQGSANDQKICKRLRYINLKTINRELLLNLSDILLSKNDAEIPYREKPFPTKDTIKIVGTSLEKFVKFKTTFCTDLIRAKSMYDNLIAAQNTFILNDFSQLYLTHYQQIKSQKGYLDFDDQILLVKKLLSQNSMAQWVMYKLDDGIEHILIDEAQDTNPDQWDVIKLLTDEFSSGETSKNKQRTIFAVGDEKQSIYSFQGADPFAFEKMRGYFSDRLIKSNKKLSEQKLLYSFRSSPTILTLVDNIFGKDNSVLNISDKHIAFKNELPGRVDLWPFILIEKSEKTNLWFQPVDSVKPNDPNLKLAEKIAAEIKLILNNNQIIGDPKEKRVVKPGDFLILLRSRKVLFHAIIKQLKLADLPVAGADRLNITTELVVKDLLSLLYFLVTPEDDLNLAVLLKSPLCGLSEQQLFRLAKNRKKSLWHKLLSQKQKHSDVLDFLHDLRNNVDFLRPYELLERILINHNKRTDLTASLGMEVEESINALLDQARNFEMSHIPDLTSFILWMESDDVYIKRELETESSTIRVMTIHGSKGLESPIVILPDTSSKPLQTNSEFIKLNDITMSLRGTKFNQPQLTCDAIQKTKTLQMQEEFRLLYVAMTRAENWLIVCGAGRRSGSKDCWYDIIENKIKSSNPKLLKQTENSGFTLKSENWIDSKFSTNLQTKLEKIQLPKWIKQPNYKQKITDPAISPSEIVGSKSLTSEESFDPNNAKMLGSQIHILLEHLPKQPTKTWKNISSNILKNYGFNDIITIKEATDHAIRILTNEKLQFMFQANSIAEAPFQINLPRFNNLLFSGIIDRIITSKNKITAIDFKTNFLIPNKENEVPIGILRQMAVYLEVLSIIYPEKEIEIAILWTKNSKLMYLDKLLVQNSIRSILNT